MGNGSILASQPFLGSASLMAFSRIAHLLYLPSSSSSSSCIDLDSPFSSFSPSSPSSSSDWSFETSKLFWEPFFFWRSSYAQFRWTYPQRNFGRLVLSVIFLLATETVSKLDLFSIGAGPEHIDIYIRAETKVPTVIKDGGSVKHKRSFLLSWTCLKWGVFVVTIRHRSSPQKVRVKVDM